MRKGCRGFQLLEMLIVMAIMGIILAMGMPHMTHLYQQTLAHQIAQRLRDSLNSARLHALQNSTDVVVCPLKEGTCMNDWQAGWSLFVDPNINRRLDSGEQAVHYFTSSNVIRIAFRNRVYRYIHFTPTGTANFTSLYLCGSVVTHGYYRVVINRSGRARVEIDNSTVCQSSSST